MMDPTTGQPHLTRIHSAAATYYERLRPEPRDVMTGKRVLITGTNQTSERMARALACRGAAVVMVSPDHARGESLRQLLTANRHHSMEVMVGDLASLTSVRRLAADYQARYGRLDVPINSATAISPRPAVTSDGIELTLAVNHVAPFLLTNLLVALLQASAPARIVTLSSPAHRYRALDLDNLDGGHRYDPQRAYAQSKLAHLIVTFELARRLAGTRVTVNAAEAGFTWASLQGPTSRLVRGGPAGLSSTPALATPIYLASSPELEAVTGRYFAQMKQVRPARRALDPTVASQVWDLTERLTGASSRPQEAIA